MADALLQASSSRLLRRRALGRLPLGRMVREGAAYPWSLEDARGTQAMLDMIFAKGNRP